MAKIVKLILSERTTGEGVDQDPCRVVKQLWTLDGVLVAEEDPWKNWSFAHLDRVGVGVVRYTD